METDCNTVKTCAEKLCKMHSIYCCFAKEFLATSSYRLKVALTDYLYLHCWYDVILKVQCIWDVSSSKRFRNDHHWISFVYWRRWQSHFTLPNHGWEDFFEKFSNFLLILMCLILFSGFDTFQNQYSQLKMIHENMCQRCRYWSVVEYPSNEAVKKNIARTKIHSIVTGFSQCI